MEKGILKAVERIPKDRPPSWPIFGMIFIGIVGMILAVVLFTAGSNSYGDVVLDQKVQLTNKLLLRRLDCLNNSIKILTGKKNSVIKSTRKIKNVAVATVLPDAAKDYVKSIIRVQNDIMNARREKLLLDSSNIDTSLLYFSKYIHVKRAVYLAALEDKSWQMSDTGHLTFNAQLIDTCRSCIGYPLSIPVSLSLRINKRSTRISFFTDYPLFGLWLVFSIAQMVLWFIIPPLLIGSINNLKQKIGHQIQTLRLLRNCTITILLTGMFLIIFYVFLIDDPVIKDHYFLLHYKDRMYFYAIIGYTVASFCFGVFVTIAQALDETNIDAGEKARVANTLLDVKFLTLKELFDNSFICSALILSFCVFWAGILINGLNGTEAFRFYYFLSGKNVIPNDFVYLLGLMNSMLLLIFYIPVKLKFNSLEITQATPVPGTQTTTTTSTIFSGLARSIGPLLITASPLLASLVQSLFKLFTNS